MSSINPPHLTPSLASPHDEGGEVQPRALLLDLSVRLGGSTVRALNLIAAFPAGTAALAALHESPAMIEARARGLEAHEVGRHKGDLLIPARLRRAIRAGGFAVLDTENPQSKWWGSLAAMGTGVALVSTLNSWYDSEHGGNLKGRLYQGLEAITARRTDVFVVVSQDIHERLLRQGVPGDSVRLIMNAVPTDPPPGEADPAGLRASFGLPTDAVVCCAVGRLVEAKGFAHLIGSMAQVARRRDNVFCLIVGEGHLRPDLEAAIRALGLDDRVRLIGFRRPDEVLHIVRACDLFVLPSLTEGTPISLLEAASLSRPIVATRAGGTPEVVEDGVHALLVDPGDEPALAAAILRLCEYPGEAAALGGRARARIEEAFSVTAQAAATLDAYRLAVLRRQHG